MYYLSKGDYDLYIPVTEEKTEGYYGCGLTFPFAENVKEVDARQVRDLDFDIILFQTDRNYLRDQYEILSEEQRRLPRIFLKHDTPPPASYRIAVEDPDVLIVHVTYFNQLMWDNRGLETRVIMHGVSDPGVSWEGNIAKGIVAINNLKARGHILGADVFHEFRKNIPLDIVGLGNEDYGGQEVLHPHLPQFMRRYRFYFSPVRYTSFPLAVCEAMMLGMPVVVLATTELPSFIKDGLNGYIHNNLDYLEKKMQGLLENYDMAARIGAKARETALEYFDLKRFLDEWNAVFEDSITKVKAL